MSNETAQSKATSEFDAYSNTYSDTVNHALKFSGLNVDFFTRVKVEYLLELIRSCFGTRSWNDVLDVGCGVGNFHSLLAGRIGSLAGIDVSQACVQVARERHPENNYREFDGEHIPHQDGSFDVAFAVNVFHHVPIAGRQPLVADIRRVLRPGGMFAIFEHNSRNPLTMHVVNNCEFDADAILLPRAETESLMTKAGLVDIATRHILTIPAAGPILRGIDRLFSRLPLGAQYYTLGRVPSG